MVWFDGARCYGADPDLWFPSRGGRAAVKTAKGICNGDDDRGPCPARTECLQYATFVRPVKEEGIWGGMSRIERRRLRKAAA